MTNLQIFLDELNRESVTTRKMLERVPDGKPEWQPHPKSMTLGRLAAHVAELPGWVDIVFKTSELDLNNNAFDPKPFVNVATLLKYYDQNLTDARKCFKEENETELDLPWTLRLGDRVISTDPKFDVIRMSFCQTVHHRAQLGVYLRLLDIPIPGSYGPSADEMF